MKAREVEVGSEEETEIEVDGGWWRRSRTRTLSLWNKASRLIRRRRIDKKFRNTSRSGSSRGNFQRIIYRRECCRWRVRIDNGRRGRRRIIWPDDDVSGLRLLLENCL